MSVSHSGRADKQHDGYDKPEAERRRQIDFAGLIPEDIERGTDSPHDLTSRPDRHSQRSSQNAATQKDADPNCCIKKLLPHRVLLYLEVQSIFRIHLSFKKHAVIPFLKDILI